MSNKYDYFEKRRNPDRSVDLLGFRPYPRHSVLAGQMGKHFLLSANTESELQSEADRAGYKVDVNSINWFHPMISAEASLPSTPQSWFDPSFAGERWDDDY